MVTKTIDLLVLPIDIESLPALLTPDTEIILTKGGILIARLETIIEQPTQRRQRVAGLGSGTTWVSDDFDDPLPDEFWLGDEALDPLYWKDQDEPNFP
jgi:antitoxin (DNA-binding transcriptional repressor) of toxin-antitoxin stability system